MEGKDSSNNRDDKIASDPNEMQEGSVPGAGDEQETQRQLRNQISELESKLRLAKDFVISINRSTKDWELLPKEWQHDSEIIKSALLCTGYAKLPPSWKSNSTVILHAIDFYRPLSTTGTTLSWRSIPEKGRCNRKVVLKALDLHPHFIKHWKNDVPASLQNDPEIALLACYLGLIKLNNAACLQDRDVLRSGVDKGLIRWTSLSKELTSDIDFARIISCFSFFTATAILESFPILRQERDVWMRIASSEGHCSLEPILNRFAPANIRSDGEIMLVACQKDKTLLRSTIDASLWDDGTFVEGILKCDGSALLKMPKDKQLVYVDLLPLHITVAVKNEYYKEARCVGYNNVARHMLPELWGDPRILKAWFQAGLPYFPKHHPVALTEDRNIFYMVGAHCRWTGAFGQASLKLRGDKVFMQQVMEANPSRYTDASAELQQDFDFALLFLGGSPREQVDRHFGNKKGSAAQRAQQYFIANMRARISQLLDIHHAFFDVFLLGFVDCHRSLVPSEQNGAAAASARRTTNSSSLIMLDQGNETNAFFKRRIAEFVGVPLGGKHRLLRQALANTEIVQKQSNSRNKKKPPKVGFQ